MPEARAGTQAAALALAVAVLASCVGSQQSPGTARTEPPPTRTPTSGFASGSPTAAPSHTAIPGLEDWSYVNQAGVDIGVDGGALTITLKRRLLWFMASRGFLMYQLVTGDFRITAHVIATKTSDPTMPAGGGSVQLGGLMARDGQSPPENYVHIVVGDDGDGSSVETKTTTNSVSTWAGPAWPSEAADLRICGLGTRFALYKRRAASDPWIEAAAYDRPDLPDLLQVGVDLYTNDVPDITLTGDGLVFASVSASADCTAG